MRDKAWVLKKRDMATLAARILKASLPTSNVYGALMNDAEDLSRSILHKYGTLKQIKDVQMIRGDA